MHALIWRNRNLMKTVHEMKCRSRNFDSAWNDMTQTATWNSAWNYLTQTATFNSDDLIWRNRNFKKTVYELIWRNRNFEQCMPWYERNRNFEHVVKDEEICL